MGILGKIAGAAGRWLGSYGKFAPSREAAETFRSGKILPELTYYHIGPAKAPGAILALESGRALRSRFWKPLDATEEDLRSRVEAMAPDPVDGQVPSGWRIFDPAGAVMGIAYSPHPSVVQVKADGRVVVHLPASPRSAR